MILPPLPGTPPEPSSADNAIREESIPGPPLHQRWEYDNERGRYILNIPTVRPFAKSANFKSTSSHSRDRTTVSKDPQKKETEERDEGTSSPQSWAEDVEYVNPRFWAKDVEYVSDGGTFIPQYLARDRGQPSEYEKSWREKGKTRIPRKLLHPRAIRYQGYPFKAEVSNAK
jgi:hypothetical protein